MRNIHCLEILERNGNQEIVKERFPFDDIPDEISNIDNNEVYNIIESFIEDNQIKEATKNRLWFILERWYPNNFYRFSRMPWKWDKEYYESLIPSHRKGM